jgi:predicted kinase
MLLNGNPGMGKTTLAQRYVDEHAMTMNLDIDNLWIMMGQWQASRPHSDRQKLKYAHALANMHLADGYDVIVPSLMQTTEQYEAFEHIASVNHAMFREAVLLSSPKDAIERCKTRARSQGHSEGFGPGGVLDTSGREQELTRMYENVLATVALRPNMVRVESVEHDIDGTYRKLLTAVA